VLGSGGRYSEAIDISAITFVPSDAVWACELTDSTGKVVASACGADKTSHHIDLDTNADALNMTTATNISKVIIY
jgi:hypothetical protein